MKYAFEPAGGIALCARILSQYCVFIIDERITSQQRLLVSIVDFLSVHRFRLTQMAIY